MIETQSWTVAEATILNERWHKADVQLTNNSFQCWWAGATSIGKLPLPMFKVLSKPTLTLFVKIPFHFGAKKIFQKENL
jgi:hypothetical protein